MRPICVDTNSYACLFWGPPRPPWPICGATAARDPRTRPKKGPNRGPGWQGATRGGRSNFIQKKTQVSFKNHNGEHRTLSAATRYQEGQRWLTLPSESSEQTNTALMVGQLQVKVAPGNGRKNRQKGSRGAPRPRPNSTYENRTRNSCHSIFWLVDSIRGPTRCVAFVALFKAFTSDLCFIFKVLSLVRYCVVKITVFSLCLLTPLFHPWH